MCLVKQPKIAAPQPLPKPAAEPPRAEDPRVQQARSGERSRLQAMSGRRSTIVTGGQGLAAPANTSGKVLLGQ